MKEKLSQILERLSVVESALEKPGVTDDRKKYKDLMQEHAYLCSVREVSQELDAIEQSLKENVLLKKESLGDKDLQLMLENDSEQLLERKQKKEAQLQTLLVPPDPLDSCNVIVEIRAGTGGDEAALFVGDLVSMYQSYANTCGWKVEVLSTSFSEMGGFKEFVMGISGDNVHRFMQYEAGTHRVQRVPATESQGRVHTSAVTVAVLTEPDESDNMLVLDDKDLRIDTYRASGAGGQHVNTTDSAVRITHLPTGAVAYCQEERSQHKNKDKAMRLLKAQILTARKKKMDEERGALRGSQIGSGDRSERIRTYNFPQNRITDHRINLTLYALDKVMEGRLDDLISPLVTHFHNLKLKDEER